MRYIWFLLLFVTYNSFGQVQGNIPLTSLRHATGSNFVVRSGVNGQAAWVKDSIYFPAYFSVASAPLTAKKGDFWRSTANGNTYYWDGVTWQLIAKTDADTSAINELGTLRLSRDTLFYKPSDTSFESFYKLPKDSIAWDSIKNKPLTFTPSTHTHTIGQVTNLQDSLNVRARVVHTHTIANVTNLQDSLLVKAPIVHNHVIGQVTGLQDSLNTRVKTVTASTPLSSSGGFIPNITIQNATTSLTGALTSTDWNTFNNKFNLPSLTSGSVLFSNGSTIAQDNSSLFWSDGLNNLGIGTNNPSDRLTIKGFTADNFIGLNNELSTGNRTFKIIAGVFGSSYNGFSIYDNVAASTRLFISNTGNVGIGNNDDTYKLSVDGNFQVKTRTGTAVLGAAFNGVGQLVEMSGLPPIGSGATNKLAYWTNSTTLSFQNWYHIDPTNRRIGMGTSTPTDGLTISGFAGTDFIALNNTLSTNNRTFKLIAGDAFGSRNGFSIYDSDANATRFNISNAGLITLSNLAGSGDRLMYSNSSGEVIAQSALTSGSVLFSNGSTIAQDNANFFWDDANNRLGIGTPTPTTKLDILGTSLTGSSTTGTILANQTWNTSGRPALIKGVVTNTASFFGNLLEFSVNGTTVLSVPAINGAIYFGDLLSGSGGSAIGPSNVITGEFQTNGSSVTLAHRATGGTMGYGIFYGVLTGTRQPTSGESGNVKMLETFNPTSGTGTYNVQLVSPTINQTGGANGITRGLYINPSITSAADFRAVEIANNTGYGVYQSGASASNLFAGKIVTTGIPSYASTAAAAADGALTAGSMFKVTNGNGTSALHIKD